MDTRKYWLELYYHLEKVGEGMRNSQSVTFGLLDAYDGLTESQRDGVNSILAEWLISDDNRLRYDASFLISQRCIKSMAGAVEEAIAVAESRSEMEARYEVKDLRRILDELK